LSGSQTKAPGFAGGYLLTGGAAGIGKAICMQLAERGAKVVVNGNFRPSGKGPEEDVAADIRARGGMAVGVNGSVASEDAARAMVDKAIGEFGQLDILVNNAGIATAYPVQLEPTQGFDEQIDVHVRGTMRVTRAAWPHLQRSGEGRILNTGSATAFGFSMPLPDGGQVNDGAYAVAKGALFSVTRQTALAGAEFGIKCNLLMPWGYSKLVDANLRGTELGSWMDRKLGVDKVAASALYLVHPECPVTGEFISSAGGRVARVVFASPRGYFNPDITPEDMRDNWAQVFGEVDQSGVVGNMYEVAGQPFEYQLLRHLLDD